MSENRDELDLFSRGDSGANAGDYSTAESEIEGNFIQEEPAEQVAVPEALPEEDIADDFDGSSKNPLPLPEIETLEEFGAYLRRVRKAENISLETVAKETRIREEYIVALENGDIDELPPGVFVLAYAKRLCRIYGINTEKLADIFELLRNAVAYELPSDISKVVNGEIDEAELRRRNRLALAFVALFSLIVLAVISGVVFLVLFLSNSDNTPLTENEIINLQEKDVLNYDRLPVPKGKTGQKR